MARLRVEPRRRFVEQQDIRFVDQRARDREPTLHPARQRLHAIVRTVRQLDELEQLVGTAAELRSGEAEVTPVDDHVLANRELHVEGVLLRDDAEARADLRAALDRVEAEHRDRPGRRRRHAADHPHGRALAGAVWAEKAECLACTHVEVDPVDRDEIAETLD